MCGTIQPTHAATQPITRMCTWPCRWIQKYTAMGFVYDEKLTEEFRGWAREGGTEKTPGGQSYSVRPVMRSRGHECVPAACTGTGRVHVPATDKQLIQYRVCRMLATRIHTHHRQSQQDLRFWQPTGTKRVECIRVNRNVAPPQMRERQARREAVQVRTRPSVSGREGTSTAAAARSPAHARAARAKLALEDRKM